MTFFQFIKSYKYCVDDNIKTFNQYRRLFKNYFRIISNVKRKKFPIKCKLRNGGTITITRHFEIMNLVLAENFGISYDIKNDIFSGFKKNSEKLIKIYSGEGAGDAAIFLEDNYSFLPVKGKVVIDLGANIGDSAIYFIIRGAKKVVGIEPNLKNFETAKKNIAINQLSNKIDLFLAGCSSKPNMITIDPYAQAGIRARLNESKWGLEISLMTLEKIMNDIDNEATVLKIDCEGCEYDVILNLSNETLKKFSHIVIEYHYGYKNIKEKLEKCGFHVSVREPRYSLDTRMHVGYLYAILI